MSATNSKKSCDKSVCDYNDFRRPRYFHGKLLDDKDFTAEQNYHAGKRRLLNRMLHGSGVVCGLDLNWKKGANWLEVGAGLALDGEGNEIWVETTEHLDLSKLLAAPGTQSKQDCPPASTTGNTTYYVAICYKEAGTDPVPVYLPGASCDDRTCEYSSDKEGYCIKLVTECPKPQEDAGLLKQLCQAGDCSSENAPDSDCVNCAGLQGSAMCQCFVLEEYGQQSVACGDIGPCGQARCVILGSIKIDSKGNAQDLCINDCREYVISSRLVKYMVSSTLSGIGDIFKVGDGKTALIDGADIARNPIQALSWMLRYFVIEKNSLNTSGCSSLFGGATDTVGTISRTEFNNLRDQLQTDDATQKLTVGRVDKIEAAQTAVLAVPEQVAAQQKIIDGLTSRLDLVEKQAAVTVALSNRLSSVESQLQAFAPLSTRVTTVEQEFQTLQPLGDRLAAVEAQTKALTPLETRLDAVEKKVNG